MKMLALPAKWSWFGPRLDNQVVRFLESLAILCRSHIDRKLLDTDAAHKAGDHAPAGHQVEHRDLFGQPHRIVPQRDDVPKQQYFGMARALDESRGSEVCRQMHTG